MDAPIKSNDSKPCSIGLMHLIFSWDMQKIHLLTILKVGIPPVKINIFQRFKYQKNRADVENY